MKDVSWRLAVIDDFENSFAFVEYRRYGELEIWNASRSTGPRRGYQITQDSVAVFVNYEKILDTTERSRALLFAMGLLSGHLAPVNLSAYSYVFK